MRNKLICVCLAIMMLIPCFANIYAEESDSALAEDYDKKYKILSSFNVIAPRSKGDYTSGDLGEYGMFRNISKSGFVNYICNIMDEKGYSDEYNSEAITTAEDREIIHKGQTDLDKPLFYEEALTMLVRLLNYEPLAADKGGYPAGYLSIAAKLDLTDGLTVGPGETLRYYDAITLLYNTINSNCAEMEKISAEDGVIYSGNSETTCLYEYRKIYRLDGVVEATEMTGLRPGTKTAKDKIRIGGNDYTVDEDFSDYIGMNAETYIKENIDDEDLVLMVMPLYNKELILKSDDITYVSDDARIIKYTFGDGREKSVTIPLVAAVIYNGQPLIKQTKEHFMPKDGSIRFIENNGDSEYDVIIICDQKTVVIDSVLLNTKTVVNTYTYDDKNINIDFSEETDDDYVRIEGMSGRMSVSDLKLGDVLHVMVSENSEGKTIIAKVSDKKVSGQLSEMFNEEEKWLVIGDSEYKLSPAYAEAIEKKDPEAETLMVGTSYSFYLDTDGKIAYAVPDDKDGNYAFVLEKASNGVMNLSYSIKLRMSGGKTEVLELADKVRINDEGSIEDKDAYDRLETAKDGVVNVIKYNINSDGEIGSIAIAEVYDNGNSGKFNVKKVSELLYRGENNSFDHDTFLEDNATIWAVNNEKKSEETSYYSVSKSYLWGGSRYSGWAYDVDEYGFAGLIVLSLSDDLAHELSASVNLFVVDNVGQSVNQYGDVVDTITGMQGLYDSISYHCADDLKVMTDEKKSESVLSDITKGDVISISLNAEGEVSYIERFHSALAGEIGQDSKSLHDDFSILKGTVEKVNPSDKRMKIKYGNGSRTVRMEDVPVIIYNASTGMLNRGTTSDIQQGDFAIVHSNKSRVTSIIIYW